MSFGVLERYNEQWFAQQCDSLSRNDPKTTMIYVQDFPLGYVQRLGQALRNNTHVASIRLNVWKVLASDIEQAVKKQDTEVGKVETIKEYIKPLLEYLETGPVLRRVEFGIDRYGPPVGEPTNSNRIAMDLVLTAIHNNPSVEELRILFRWIPMHFFQTLLPTTTSLKKLDVEIVGDHPRTLEERLLVSEGIKLNSSLTSIRIMCRPELIESILTGLADKGGNHQLQELVVAQEHWHRESTFAFWPALSHYLFAKTRGVEFHLKLDGLCFTKEDVKELVQCLIGFDPTENSGDRVVPACFSPVISKLTLCDCSFDDDDAKDAWCNFLQTRVEQAKVGNKSMSTFEASSRPIRELCLDEEDRLDDSWMAADLIPTLCTQSPMDKDVKPRAKGEQPSPAATLPVLQEATVGSQIQSLSVSLKHSCFDGLFQGLADKAEQIRIQKLGILLPRHLDYTAHVATLTECLGKVSTLRELHFHDRFRDEIDLPDEIVARFKENGHIKSVSSNVTSKLVHAYCQRNQCLGQLLMESSDALAEQFEYPADHKQDATTTPTKRLHSEMQGCASTSVDDDSDGRSRSSKKLKSSLCPTLCQSAMEMPSMRLSLLSRTLLRLQESIAPLEARL